MSDHAQVFYIDVLRMVLRGTFHGEHPIDELSNWLDDRSYDIGDAWLARGITIESPADIVDFKIRFQDYLRQ